MDGLNLEIWFLQQDQVSIFLESSVADPDEERFQEVALFALFATRQVANLSGDWVAQSLASTLLGIDLDRPVEDVREKLGDVRIVTPSAPGGRKGFTAALRPEKRGFFKMNPRGFGLLGKGVGYYAPTSTLALLAYLLDRRSDDEDYVNALVATAKLVGAAGAEGAIGVTSSAPIAMKAAAQGWGAAQAFAAQLAEDDEDVDNSGDAENSELITEAARLASLYGVDLSELAGAIVGAIAAARPTGGDPEKVMVFPTDVLRRVCAVDFVVAAELDDRRLDEAFARPAPTSSEAIENLQGVALEVLAERGLTPVVDALVVLITTDDVDEALRA